MKIIPIDPSVRTLWKTYPVRIPGGSRCPGCREETILVQSMEGGFVSRNCPRCNRTSTLPEATFKKLALWVACPECKRRMQSRILPDRNYGFVCAQCNVGVPLFGLVPRWTDL